MRRGVFVLSLVGGSLLASDYTADAQDSDSGDVSALPAIGRYPEEDVDR